MFLLGWFLTFDFHLEMLLCRFVQRLAGVKGRVASCQWGRVGEVDGGRPPHALTARPSSLLQRRAYTHPLHRGSVETRSPT